MSRSLLLYFSLVCIAAATYAQNSSSDRDVEEHENTETEKTSGIKAADLNQVYADLKIEVEKSTEKVKELYFLKKEITATYGGGTQTVTRLQKPNIYKSAEKLRKHYVKAGDESASKDIASQIEILRKLEKLNDRLTDLSGVSNTKALEKRLKKIKDPAELEQILLEE